MEKDIGCILHQLPLGENGLIVCWCTAGHGIIRTAARGARKPGSDYTGRLDLFHECELLFSPARSGDLHNLGSVTLISPRLGLRHNLTKLRLASYMARLMLATVEPGSGTSGGAPEDAAWHRLISAALDYLEQSPSPPRAAILHRFEHRLAELQGLYSPAIPPYRALLNHFRHLPAGRAELLEKLG